MTKKVTTVDGANKFSQVCADRESALRKTIFEVRTTYFAFVVAIQLV